ncbi:MAG: type II toxin-antitoxin system RelE/ParE family toxin [Bacteroidota bacterium]
MKQHNLQLTPEAELDIDDAYNWYEDQQDGLGERFLEHIENAFQQIAKNSLVFRYWHPSFRGYVLPTFPYVILYRATKDEVQVVSVFHTSRDPKPWDME